MLRALYRSQQVLHALRPRLDAAELELARSSLTAEQAALFAAMERRDQRHALAVWRRLRLNGATDRDLWAAALLHDCGKGRVPVWLRVLYVLWPAAVRRLAVEGAAGARGAAYRLAHHAELGARLAEMAGSSPTTVRLIADRPLPAEEGLAALLTAADDAS